MKSFVTLLFALCCVAPAYAAAPAAATPAATNATQSVRSVISGWHLECDPTKDSVACHVQDQVDQAPSGALLINLSFSLTPDGKAKLTMNTPFGVSVHTPIVVSVTDGPSQSVPFLTCAQQGCFAYAVVDAGLIAAMRAGKGELHVAFSLVDSNLTDQAVTATLPLTGFSEVFDHLK